MTGSRIYAPQSRMVWEILMSRLGPVGASHDVRIILWAVTYKLIRSPEDWF